MIIKKITQNLLDDVTHTEKVKKLLLCYPSSINNIYIYIYIIYR